MDGGEKDESHPTRGGWIEICPASHPVVKSQSHPTRGGWIEIKILIQILIICEVPPHTGWVD